MNTIKGKVKWWNDSKGYGILAGELEGHSTDFFAHWSAIQGNGFSTLSEGQEVEFEVYDGPKGLQAANIIKK